MRNYLSTAAVLFLANLSVRSQTGPGGVGTSANNELWLMADSGVYTDAGTTLATNGQSAQQWMDVSGNGINAIQNTAGFRPLYQTSQTNGMPALDFDGNDDRILSSGVGTAGSATIFTVVRAEGLSTNNDGIVHGAPSGLSFSTSATDKSIGIWLETATRFIWGRGVETDNTQANISKVTQLTVGTFYVILTHYNGSSITQYVNGNTAGTVAYDGTLRSWTEFGIGRQGTESFNGDIAEVIAYSTSLNAAQLIIVNNYLKAKYGLTLGANNIYQMDTPGNGDYDFEVAGIGRGASAAITHTDSRGTAMVRISKSGAGLGNNEYLLWGHENGPLTSFGYTDVPGGVQARLGRKWRVSEQGEVGNINIDFDLTNLGAVTVTDLRLLIDADGDGDFTDAVAYSGATDQGGNIYRFTTAGDDIVDNGYGFTIATINTAQTPLPIDLLEFRAEMDNSRVKLDWITLSEINNALFEVERSADLQSWESILQVDGAGNSRSRLSYTAYDESPLPGTNYYRLKQVDYNGAYSYSDIDVVDFTSEYDTELIIMPNPVSRYVTIKCSQGILGITIINQSGEQVRFLTMDGEKTQVTSLSGLPGGIYFFLVQTSTSREVAKVAIE